MNRLLAMTALALVMAAPAYAQGQGRAQDQDQQQRQERQTQAQARDQGPYAASTGRTVAREAVSARLISAEQLVDKTVVARNGQQIGTVDYITVDPASGQVSTLLVRATALDRDMPQLNRRGEVSRDGGDQRGMRQSQGGQAQGGQSQDGQAQGGQAQLIALPWHAVDLNLGAPGEVVFPAPIGLARQLPTFSEQEIAQVTSPRFLAQIVEYYAPVEGGQPGMQGQTQQRQQQGQMDRGMRGQQQAQMLVGRGVVGMLAPPEVTTADNMRGLPIETADGETVGEIDMVMINADTGAVDYVLVNQSTGDQGADMLIPVAYGDLTMASDASAFTLDDQGVVVGVLGATGSSRMAADRGGRQQSQRMGQGQFNENGRRVIERMPQQQQQAGAQQQTQRSRQAMGGDWRSSGGQADQMGGQERSGRQAQQMRGVESSDRYVLGQDRGGRQQQGQAGYGAEAYGGGQ